MRLTSGLKILGLFGLTFLFGYLAANNLSPLVRKNVVAEETGPIVTGDRPLSTFGEDKVVVPEPTLPDEPVVVPKVVAKAKAGGNRLRGRNRMERKTKDGGTVVVERNYDVRSDPGSSFNIQMDVNLDGVKLEDPPKKGKKKP